MVTGCLNGLETRKKKKKKKKLTLTFRLNNVTHEDFLKTFRNTCSSMFYIATIFRQRSAVEFAFSNIAA